MYRRFFKRFLDIFFSSIAIVVLSPLFVVLLVLVRINLGKPVIFTQERIGRGEKSFKLYKFRSMTNQCDENGILLPDSIRLTKFGKILRSTSLDELPEIYNILKGDMSIIGPRPMPIEYLPYFKDEERIIHSIRGGLIPPDVLSLHSVFDWDEQFGNEMDYVKHFSFLYDLKILFSVFLILFKRNKYQYGGEVRKPLSVVRKDRA